MNHAVNDDKGHLWAVHSSKNDMPMMRAWAKSEAAANERMAELQRSDATPDDSYWVTQMTPRQIEAFKGNGFIPADA
jgi:sugar lactone lactonase YvrE